jgi:outer membrane protein insertion porin family
MFSQELELKYLEPYIFSYPFNIGGGFFQKKQDTTYVQRKFDAYIEFLATNEITFALTFGSESVIPTISDVPRFIVFNSSLVLTGLNFRIDTRNDPFSPTSGLLFINSYLYSLKKINGPEEFIPQNFERSINLQRLSVDFSYFWEIFNRQVIAVGLFGRELRGSHLEISDLYRLGGTNSLVVIAKISSLAQGFFGEILNIASFSPAELISFLFSIPVIISAKPIHY